MDCIVHGVAKSQTRLSDFHWLISRKPLKEGLDPSYAKSLSIPARWSK